MKKGIVFLGLIVFMFCFLSACSSSKSNKAEKYIGVWYGYKVSTDDGDIVFEDYANLVKMELTAEFTSDGKYTLHYYIDGSEGENYPQKGRYKIDGGKIILTEDEGVGKIVDGELILSFDNGAVKQYFRSDKENAGEKPETSENNKEVMITIEEFADYYGVKPEGITIKETKDGYTYEVDFKYRIMSAEYITANGEADKNKNIKSINIVCNDIETSWLHDLSKLKFAYQTDGNGISKEEERLRYCCVLISSLCDKAEGEFYIVDYNDWYKLFNGETYIINNWRISSEVDESNGKVTLKAIREELTEYGFFGLRG